MSTSACIQNATTVIGDKWNPRIIFALSNHVTRFCHIQRELDQVNPRSLSIRLDKLESQGIVAREMIDNNPLKVEYALTDKGKALLPIIKLMVQWSDTYKPVAE